MADKRRKDAIWTYTGRVIRPLDPDPGDIAIEDIAHSLANQCRFTGHTSRFYSVAQHSVLVSTYVGQAKIAAPLLDKMTLEEFRKILTWGLLHDASEAYLSDIARPIKRYQSNFGEAYAEIENRLMAAVAKAFELELPMPDIVKTGDDVVLRAEAINLMPDTFPLKSSLMEGEATDYWPKKIRPWSPEFAEGRFLDRWKDLS